MVVQNFSLSRVHSPSPDALKYQRQSEPGGLKEAGGALSKKLSRVGCAA
jgi:hypothetical protein